MNKSVVFLNPAMRTANVNPDKLLAHARSVAEGIMLPAGIEFAKFEFGGKTYALTARVEVQVNPLEAKVSNRVFRDGAMKAGLEWQKKQREAARKAK
jgi:hypothetical protein